jgi:23S rRNA pseudouridine1911/1915/1917 synthase
VKQRPPGIDEQMIELEFRVAREFAGWRADRFVALKIPRLSRTRVQRILKQHAFAEDGSPIKPNRTLKENERITIYKPLPDEPPVTRDFAVLFEDDWLLAVNKPAGLPVHPTARYYRNTLTALLSERYGEPRPVLTHRLDSETSGVLLCAKGLETERALKRMFAERKVAKRYLAVVAGLPDPPSGRIEAALGPDPDSVVRVKMGCDVADGLPALTEYETLETGADRALLRLKPRTGRQHQLRAHLAHLGHPIVGDKMYGPDERLFLDYIEGGLSKEDIVRRSGHHRQALHAAVLTLTHPATGKETRLESPLPDELRRLLVVG